MNSRMLRIATATAALCGLALSGCNAVSNGSDGDAAVQPTPTVVLQGTIAGLGSKRSIVIQNGDSGLTSFVADDPALPTAEIPSTRFSFGAVPQGAGYNIIVKTAPYGKTCTVVNASGTITTAEDLAAHPITVNCANDPAVPRYDLTVALPDDATLFSGIPGATVSLKTEEQIYSQTVTSGQTSVTFPGAVFNAASQPNNPFNWTVTATAREADGSQTRCFRHQRHGFESRRHRADPARGHGRGTDPTGLPIHDVGIGGLQPAARRRGPPPAFPAGGTDPGGARHAGECRGHAGCERVWRFTVGGATPTLFPSNSNAVYDVVVTRQPTGFTCIVGDGGGVNFYTTGSNNPVSATSTGTAVSVRVGALLPSTGIALGSRLNVYCRATPDTVFRQAPAGHPTGSPVRPGTPNINTPVPVVSNYLPFRLDVQNTASSNMLTLFDDGTFLYGTHAANTSQAAQGQPVLTGQSYATYPTSQAGARGSTTTTQPAGRSASRCSPIPTRARRSRRTLPSRSRRRSSMR